MGYRSEVGIKCQEKAFRKLFTLCKEIQFKPDTVYVESYSWGNEYTMCWDWVKWYEEYYEIKSVINVLDELDKEHEEESDDKLGYRFVRIGEDLDDNEIRQNDWELELHIVRKLDIDEDAVEYEEEEEED